MEMLLHKFADFNLPSTYTMIWDQVSILYVYNNWPIIMVDVCHIYVGILYVACEMLRVCVFFISVPVLVISLF